MSYREEIETWDREEIPFSSGILVVPSMGLDSLDTQEFRSGFADDDNSRRKCM